MLSVFMGTGIFGKTAEEGQKLRDVSSVQTPSPKSLNPMPLNT